MQVLLALLPILVILFLLVWRRMPADLTGLIGWVLPADRLASSSTHRSRGAVKPAWRG